MNDSVRLPPAAADGNYATGRNGSVQTVLVTGFGGFPGARVNPTIPLAQALAKSRRARARGVRVVSHVFRTAYAAVDADVARLLDMHAPDAVLMFGLAARTPFLRIETLARNRTASLVPDAAGIHTSDLAIRPGAPTSLRGRAAVRRVLQAARTSGVPVRLSRDAGDYLCNYLYWRMLEATAKTTPALFVHVPAVRDAPRRPGKRRGVMSAELARAAEAILLAFVAASRR